MPLRLRISFNLNSSIFKQYYYCNYCFTYIVMKLTSKWFLQYYNMSLINSISIYYTICILLFICLTIINSIYTSGLLYTTGWIPNSFCTNDKNKNWITKVFLHVIQKKWNKLLVMFEIVKKYKKNSIFAKHKGV